MDHYVGDGGPAISENRDEGLSVRDYFAAKAMQSVCDSLDPWGTAYRAYQIADAMMNVRQKK